MTWTMEKEWWMVMNKTLQGQEIWKDIGAHLQEPEANLVFHVPAQKASTSLDNEEAGALVKMHTLATDSSVDTVKYTERVVHSEGVRLANVVLGRLHLPYNTQGCL